MVLTEVVNSLAKIDKGNVSNNVNAIYSTWLTYNHTRNPDNRLALAVLNAFDEYVKEGRAKQYPLILQTVMQIAANASYVYPVRHRAQIMVREIGLSKSSDSSGGGKQ
jgi:hypothetical protein